MRAYKVVGHVPNGDIPETTHDRTRFAGTQADARNEKQALMNDYDLKRSAVEIKEVEIPTAKAELIEFINELVQ